MSAPRTNGRTSPTPREKFIIALEGRQPPGRVPHFELVFFLTMEAFGRVHPSQRRYDQWDQMTETERALHVDGRIRAFAGRTTSCLQLAAATLVTTWVVALTPWREGSVAEGLTSRPVIAGLVVAVVVLRRASPRPPRRWQPAPLVEAA